MENTAIVYLYLYLAIADKDFSEMEASIIISKLKDNPAFTGMDTSDFVDEIYKNFLRLPIDAVILYLENYIMDIILSDAARTRVLSDLEEIMEADGIIRKEELIAFQRIKKYLSYNTGLQHRASA